MTTIKMADGLVDGDERFEVVGGKAYIPFDAFRVEMAISGRLVIAFELEGRTVFTAKEDSLALGRLMRVTNIEGRMDIDFID